MYLTYLQELIDTCWDVNAIRIMSISILIFELIDTCWDVNEYNL